LGLLEALRLGDAEREPDFERPRAIFLIMI